MISMWTDMITRLIWTSMSANQEIYIYIFIGQMVITFLLNVVNKSICSFFIQRASEQFSIYITLSLAMSLLEIADF